jgi:hypothetical protein
MALFNEILVGRFNRALQKVFGLKGGPPAPQLAGEIGATVNMLWGAETQYLEGWQNYAIAVVVAVGGAGTRCGVRIDNPKGSNVCAVIEKITFVGQPAVTDNPQVNYSILSSGPMPGGVITANIGLDQRGPQTPQLPVTAQNTAAAILGINIWQGALAVNSVVDVIQTEHQELPLLPNSSYSFYSAVLNQSLSVNIMWRERPLEASEIT